MKNIEVCQNRIISQDYPDPDVIRVDDTYYMVSTTMYYFPGAVILRSYNLVNWEIVSYVFEELDGTKEERLEDNKNLYGHGMWAPSFRYHNGKFYIAFVSHGQENTHLFIADKIEGPWEHRMIKGYYHDCSLLFEDDNIFIVHGNMNIHLTELADDLSGPKRGGIDKIIIKDDPEKVRLGFEGAHFYKINNRYLITLIHWPADGMRTESVFVSDRVDGEYIGKDVLSDDGGYLNQGIAQGGIVDTPDGKWYAILFQDSGAVGRIPSLMPIEWKDGFPVFENDRKATRNFTVTDYRPDYKYESLINSSIAKKSLDNKQYIITPQWQWNHIPNKKLVEIKDERSIRVETGKLSVNPMHAINTLTHRTTYPSGSARISLDYSGLRIGDTAGLIVLIGQYAMAGVRRDKDGFHKVLIVSNHKHEGFDIGLNDYEDARIIIDEIIDNPDCKCNIEALTCFENMKDEVRFFIDDKEITKEAIKIEFKLDLFTGARIGMCIYSQKEIGGVAEFRVESILTNE